MWTALFLLITVALFLFPLLPSLAELKFATDARPLRVIQEYDTEITHFAFGFKTWLMKNFSEFFSVGDKSIIRSSEGTLQDHTAFQIIGSRDTPFFSRGEISSATTHKLIIAASSLRLTKEMFFESEIYSAGAIEIGGHSQFRALLAEGDITLGEKSTVLRWLHSHGSLQASAGCNLFGRASTEESITLAEHCRFERLHAGTILFGQWSPLAVPKNIPLIALKELPNIKDKYQRRWLIEGNIDIPVRRTFDGDLVATKNLRIGAGSHITGNLKSSRDMYIAAGVHIQGSIISSGNLHMEPGCVVAGPVVAENTILIEENSIIGSESMPTTITAPKIFITSGVIAHGTVWADEYAVVLPAPESNV